MELATFGPRCAPHRGVQRARCLRAVADSLFEDAMREIDDQITEAIGAVGSPHSGDQRKQ